MIKYTNTFKTDWMSQITTTSRWLTGKRQRDSAVWIWLAVVIWINVKLQEYIEYSGSRGISSLTSVTESHGYRKKDTYLTN